MSGHGVSICYLDFQSAYLGVNFASNGAWDTHVCVCVLMAERSSISNIVSLTCVLVDCCYCLLLT